jgi:hypothetical protein
LLLLPRSEDEGGGELVVNPDAAADVSATADNKVPAILLLLLLW